MVETSIPALDKDFSVADISALVRGMNLADFASSPLCWRDLSHVVDAFEYEELFEEFGEDFLFWGWSQERDPSKHRLLSFTLAECAGYTSSLLHLAHTNVVKRHKTQDSLLMKDTYTLYSAARGDFTSSCDLPYLLNKHRTTPRELSEERLKSYDLVSVELRGLYATQGFATGIPMERFVEGVRHHFPLYIDSPVGFTLRQGGVPQSTVSFNLLPDRTLLIEQLQGENSDIYDSEQAYWNGAPDRKVKPRGLAVFSYKDLLCDVVADLGRELGHRVAIQGAANNRWTKPLLYEDEPHLSLERATVIYDDFARKRGFEKRLDGNWYDPC